MAALSIPVLFLVKNPNISNGSEDRSISTIQRRSNRDAVDSELADTLLQPNQAQAYPELNDTSETSINRIQTAPYTP